MFFKQNILRFVSFFSYFTILVLTLRRFGMDGQTEEGGISGFFFMSCHGVSRPRMERKGQSISMAQWGQRQAGDTGVFLGGGFVGFGHLFSRYPEVGFLVFILGVVFLSSNSV